MAKDDIRYYLKGMYFEKAPQGGIYIVATDGHMMTVIHDAKGDIAGADNCILKITPAMVAACKAVGSSHAMPSMMIAHGKRLSVACDFGQEQTSGETYVQAGDGIIEGKFPDYRRVIPDFAKLNRGAFTEFGDISSAYLARLVKIHGTKHLNSVAFWQETARSAVIVQHVAVPEMITIIMPVHGESSDILRSRFEPFAKPVTEPVPA